MSKRLRTDTAMAMTKAVCDCFRWSDAAEYRECFDTVHTVIAAGLETYAIFAAREQKRLGKNTTNPKEIDDAPSEKERNQS